MRFKGYLWFILAIGILAACAIMLLLFEEKLKRLSIIKTLKIFADNQSEERFSIVENYNIYNMTLKEKVFYRVMAIIVVFTCGYIFYRNFYLSVLITPIGWLYPKYKTREKVKKRKQELNLQFKEALYSLSSSLSAGKSVELAFKEVLRDMKIQYPNKNTNIINELQYIVKRIEMNETIEVVLQDFSSRSDVEDIRNFADAMQTCKRTGGNLVQVIKNTCEIISDKIEIRQEIDTMLAQKRYEQKVLSVMPVFLILFISAGAGDFMQPVFRTIQGNLVMTLALVILFIADSLAKKIMDIEV